MWNPSSEKQYRYESEWLRETKLFTPAGENVIWWLQQQRANLKCLFLPLTHYIYVSSQPIHGLYISLPICKTHLCKGHTYLLSDPALAKRHCWQPFAVRNAGFHKWKTQVITTLPGCQHHFFQMYTYKQMVVISDWLKNLFILLVALKDFELNLHKLQRSVAL